ncbi:MAG: hypothetical protein NVV74_17080 [Magnetospirillum sp.]|nr:hypothetical protein [Magnetospirillum sp.]
MVGQIFDDVRRILLSLLFVVAFGWMAAQILPGQVAGGSSGPQVAQLTLSEDVVPPRP